MRVKALRVEDGFLIPLIDKFKEVEQNTIMLNVEFIDSKEEKVPTSGKKWPDKFFEEVVGGWNGDLERPDQGNYEIREDF